jgi:hypothetical protein
MKKALLVAVVAGFAMTSCKKDYTCACTNVPVLGTINIEIPKAKKKDAQATCDQAETTYKVGDPNASCELK